MKKSAQRTICRWCDSIDLAILNGDGSHMWNHRQHIPIEPWPLQEPLTAVFPALSHGSRTYWWTKVNLPVQVSKHGPWGYAENGIKLGIKPTKNGDLHGLEEKNFKNDCRFIFIYLDLSSFILIYLDLSWFILIYLHLSSFQIFYVRMVAFPSLGEHHRSDNRHATCATLSSCRHWQQTLAVWVSLLYQINNIYIYICYCYYYHVNYYYVYYYYYLLSLSFMYNYSNI